MSAQDFREEWNISPDDIKYDTEVLKKGQSFLACLPGGGIPRINTGELGFYYQDTRFLSCHEIFLQGLMPVFLSGATRDSHFAQVELSNREITGGHRVLPQHTIHLRLQRVLKGSLFQRLRIINFNNFPVNVTVTVVLGADFKDIFEVRGLKRLQRGELRTPRVDGNKVVFSYRGLDNSLRETTIFFSRDPDRVHMKNNLVELDFDCQLPVRQKKYLVMQVDTGLKKDRTTQPDPGKKQLWSSFYNTAGELIMEYDNWKKRCTLLISDHEIFNEMINAGITDLYSLITDYPGWGRVVEAGIPWYSVPFGRDALITSWQTLMINPDLARETLKFLVRWQGQEDIAWREEKPGKILHEMRFGEMAAVEEVPHTPYYGSVDSTLWFIILLSEYVRWTNDRLFLKEMEDALLSALSWCCNHGDGDGDGFIEYRRESERGLLNQGWKDSWDGVLDREGNIPSAPIALVEVQAYYYLALIRAVPLLRQLKREGEAQKLSERAAELRSQFGHYFWLEEEKYTAFALNGAKQQVKTTVSNGGHCLLSGILPRDNALQVAQRLFEKDMYSGWGIRTMSSQESSYNPMSYHNGSVWPHDNAIIARGLRKYNALEEMKRVADNLFHAARYFHYYRLPELFCGFTRRGAAGPVQFPTACNPQAWAVGSTFLLLQALLGIECRGNNVFIERPVLPEWMNQLTVYNMRVGDGKVDLEFLRRKDKTYCSVLKREGNVRIIVEP